MLACKKTNRTRFRNDIINPLIENGLLEMTIPQKQQSSLQKYRTTKEGFNNIGNYKKNEKR